MINLESISLQRGSKFLLEGASLRIYPGERWGLIGANGSGKTSLFRLLLGELQEDNGSCNVPRQWNIAHMAQEFGDNNSTALDYVLDGDAEYRELEKQIDQHQGEGEALARLYERFEVIGAYSAASRAQQLISGLGFTSEDAATRVSEFSGGWRIRLNLAQALMCRSDLLLLDEPTNHLDLDASLWLESWLKSYPGTLLIISHDRDFLDNVVNGIVHLDQQQLSSYTGNYSSFERQRSEKLAQQAQQFAKQQERIAEIENFVRRFRAKASKAKQAQSRLKELERMEKIAPAHVDSPFNFSFLEPEKTPQQLVNLSEVAIGYDRALVEKLELSIVSSSRIGLLGHNGAGKSTLIKSLARELPLVAGEYHASEHLNIGYFAQHQMEALDMQASPALHIQRLSPQASEQEIRNYLGGFDFRGDRAFENIHHFSGVEKARLAFAIVVWQKPNLLLLDEPTNHLDLEMCQALTEALQLFDGAMVVVSHDRHLLKNTVDEFLVVDSGRVEAFDGTIEDYQRWLLKSSVEEEPNTVKDSGTQDKKALRQQAAAQRERLKPLTNALKKAEKTIEQVQPKLDKLEERLADSKLYEDDSKTELNSLLAEQLELRRALAEAEEQWLRLSEEIEASQ
jgi:ATP-binding cassette subfamily F protein 3